jgi:hypothetical protein
MQNPRVLLVVGASIGAVAVACGSSSSSPITTTTAASDAGDDSAMVSVSGDDGGMGATCLPLGGTGCAMGMECCLDLSGGLMAGKCVPPGMCNGNIQIECEKGSDCASGQVCCASLGGVDAGTIAALVDGGLGALGIDASSLSLDAGAAGLGGLGSISFGVTCAQSCTSSEIQACASSTECAGGGTCSPLAAVLGDGGGALGDGGIPGGLAMYASALGMVMACVPTDAGMTTSVPDAGGPVDAIAPTDAPSDAVSE